MIGLYLRRARRKLCEAGVSMAKKIEYDDDDGRVVADMSEIDPMPLMIPRFRKSKQEPESPTAQQFSKEDRRAVVLGAIGSAVLIGAIFIAAAAIVIAVLQLVWN